MCSSHPSLLIRFICGVIVLVLMGCVFLDGQVETDPTQTIQVVVDTPQPTSMPPTRAQIPSPTLTQETTPPAVIDQGSIAPAPSYSIDPQDPPGDWYPLEFGISVIYLPPDFVIVEEGGRMGFAFLPVSPGTGQEEIQLYANDEQSPDCNGFRFPDAVFQGEITFMGGQFEYTFQREEVVIISGYRQVDSITFWMHDGYACVSLSMDLLSYAVDRDGDPVTAFDVPGWFHLMEIILYTFRQLG